MVQQAHHRLLKAYSLFPIFFLIAFLAYFLLKMGMDWAMVELADPREGPWKVQVVTGLIDVIFSIVMVLSYGFCIFVTDYKAVTLGEFLNEKLGSFITENLLAISRILLWSLLLIIPGLVFYIYYLFVSNIVFFHPKYQSGELNALQESKRITKPHFFKLLPVIFILGLLSLFFELGSKLVGLTLWWQEMFFFLAAFYLSGFSFMLFYGLYKKYEEQI